MFYLFSLICKKEYHSCLTAIWQPDDNFVRIQRAPKAHNIKAYLDLCANYNKINRKACPLSQRTIHFDGTAMGFDNRLCQRQTKSESLGVFGKTAAIKPLEYMIQILRMDTAPVIHDPNLDNRRKLLPCDTDSVFLFGMVQGIFH